MPPTPKMIGYARQLLGIYEERRGEPYTEVDPESIGDMTFEEVSQLIDDLKFELDMRY